MRPSSVVVISLLVLSLFLTGAQGIRFKKLGLFSFGQQHDKTDEGRSSLMKTSDDHGSSVIGGGVLICKEGHCNTAATASRAAAGMINRKLISTINTNPTTTSKNDKINGDDDDQKKAKAKPTSRDNGNQQQQEAGHFPINSPPPTTTSDDDGQQSHDSHSSRDHLYVDIADIAEMDYSPAKRKPPIHN